MPQRVCREVAVGAYLAYLGEEVAVGEGGGLAGGGGARAPAPQRPRPAPAERRRRHHRLSLTSRTIVWAMADWVTNGHLGSG